MSDRPTPNLPAWVHTRLSNLEAAVGDLTVRLVEAPTRRVDELINAAVQAERLSELDRRFERLKEAVVASTNNLTARVNATERHIVAMEAALEGAATPVCAPVAAATGADGLREPGEAEAALSDTPRCDQCCWSSTTPGASLKCQVGNKSMAPMRAPQNVHIWVNRDHYCAAFEARR